MLLTLLLLTLAADGGTPDAGVPDAGSWRWIDGDGGWLLDGGSTDILTLRTGETARIVFPFPIVLMQCDEPLLGLGATEDTLLLTGLKTGHTACGFWFYQRAWPHRSMDVTVTK
ncbi:MAG: hypothetical protein Q8N23_24025 [Archangium sp.]|nr:hypothetical protein [Archangium sp.]MDP3155762.1 hypothetical protein [Archangium sp.]MDP3574004.1 hypothetical protein [Archangium sp.]